MAKESLIRVLWEDFANRSDRYIIYTSLFNMIDYPAMTIPLDSQVSADFDPVDKDFKAANPRDAAMQAQCEYKNLHNKAARPLSQRPSNCTEYQNLTSWLRPLNPTQMSINF